MIEMSLQELLNSVPVLRKVVNKPMSARTAYWFARVIKEVEKETEAFGVAQKGLIEKYGQKDNEGNFVENDQGVVVAPEMINDFNKEASELLETKVKIEYDPIDIGNLDGLEFSPSDIDAIIGFIK